MNENKATLCFQEARKAYGISQEKLAVMVGISREHLNRIETGRKIPSSKLLEKIQSVLEQCNPENPLELLFDYVRIRYPSLDVKHIIENVLQIQMRHWQHEDHGFFGYPSHYHMGDLIVCTSMDKEKQGVLLELRGKGCRQMEAYLSAQKRSWYDFFQASIEEHGIFKRIDLAVNDKTGILDIPELAKKCQKEECISVFRSFKHYRSGDLLRKGEKEYMGNTLYIGSFSSEIYFCIYEKDIEQAIKMGVPVDEADVKNRFEIRLKNERAQLTVLDLLLHQDVEATVFAIINRYLRFVDRDDSKKRESWQLNARWSHFLGHNRNVLHLSVKPKPYTLERTAYWFQVQVAPSAKLMRKLDKFLGTEHLENMIENAKLSEKQEKLFIQLALPVEELIIQNEEKF